jgi:hypothetical protein
MTRLIFIFCTLLVSCRQNANFNKERFNQEGWQKISDLGQHPEREKMVNDLIQNHNLKGLHYNELIKKLGPPDFWEPENRVIYFGLATNYGVDLDPTGQRSLKFQFSLDSIITNFAIDESGR